ncbi:MAG: DNA-binding protein [Proteiniphilum sp.]|nr:DNA-binding protein [Proteiniphilum sp.]
MMNKIIVTTPEELRLIVKEAVIELNSPREEKKTEADTVNLEAALQVLTENGYPTSKGKMYKLTSEGKIPHKMYNNKLVFSRKEILKWAENQAKPKYDASETIRVVAQSARRKMR